MSTIAREVYVISDLHLGGTYPDPGVPGDRGFRMNTHADDVAGFIRSVSSQPASEGPVELVINGDVIDFLAENEGGADPWSPFTADPALAARKLSDIAARDPQVFEALGNLLRNGHALTICQGNHDIELGFPQVRERLEEILGVEGHHDFRLFYDGEAYVVGDALIEHGNRYDPFNVIDNDGLRRYRSLLSRRQNIPKEYEFTPPAGSLMVSSVINPIKKDYAFVDLLKPEDSAMVPILFALEPGYRKLLGKAVKVALKASKHKMEEADLPSFGGDISSGTTGAEADLMAQLGGMTAPKAPAGSGSGSEEDDALSELLSDVMGSDAREWMQEVQAEVSDNIDGLGSDISAKDAIDRASSLMKIMFSPSCSALEKRMVPLLKALRTVQAGTAFDRSIEGSTCYLNAAESLAETGGFNFVLFGHTHLAKDVEMKGGARYLNSGTWANLMRFPQQLVEGSDAEAMPRLQEFVNDLKDGNLDPWTTFRPTYIHLTVDEHDRVSRAEVCDYSLA